MRHSITKFVTLVLTVMAGTGAAAGETALQDSVTRVWEFYLEGTGNQVVVGELKACLEVDTARGSETRFDCVGPVEGPVAKNTKVAAWLAYVMPKGSEADNVAVQFKHNGVVRITRDLTLKGKFFRNRSFSSYTLNKSGPWEIVILQDTRQLASVSLTVQ